jgi:superfamily II DNA/RNA helicase
VVNSAADLWPVLAGPFYHLQSWGDFASQFTNTKADGVTPTGIKNAPALADILRPYVLRRTIDSVGIKLPPLTVEEFEIEIDQVALDEITTELVDWTPERVSALINGSNVNDGNLARIRHKLGLAKAGPVSEYVKWLMEGAGQLESAGPIVVFFHHTDVRDRLYNDLHAYSGYEVNWIDGNITPKRLVETEAAFQGGEIDILLAQTQAAGQGLTLHRANTCVHAELPWTSVAVDQATARIWRIGQARPCTAHVLRAMGCWLEDVMASIVSGKRKAADNLLNLLTTNK